MCQQIWKTQQWAQDWERSVFILIPKKGNAKECSSYCTIVLILHASKIMLKILQASFNSMWTMNFQMVKLDLEKVEEPEIKLLTSAGNSKRVPEKQLLLLYWLCQSLWLCGSQQAVEKYERDGIPDHLACLLRNMYASQEATVRTGHGTTDWFQIGKGVHQGYILSLYSFNLHAEYIMINAWLDEADAVIKIAGRKINNLRYADNSEEELKSLLIKVKE